METVNEACQDTRRERRMLIHCQSTLVSREVVEAHLRKELGEDAKLAGYQVEPQQYFVEVSVGSGTRMMPVTAVIAYY